MMQNLLETAVLAMSVRMIGAYASIFFAVIGVVLLIKYLPRWLGKDDSSKTETALPGGGIPGLPAATGEAQILILKNGVQDGPYTADQVRHLVAFGQVDAASLCWQPGQKDWKPIREVL